MEEDIKKIAVIDWLVMMGIAFWWLGTMTWELTTFQKLIIAFLIGSVFLVLLHAGIVGKILQVIVSGIWTAALMELIPFYDWVKGDIKWLVPIAVVIFISVLGLHGTNVFKLKGYLEKKRVERTINKIESKNGEYISYIINMFESDKIRYDRIYAEMGEEVFKKNVGQIPHIADFIKAGNFLCRHRHEEIFYSKFPRFQEDVLGFHDIMDTWEIENRKSEEERKKREDREREDREWKRVREEWEWRERERERAREERDEKKDAATSSADANRELFKGCKTSADLKKRYHELMKTFHPDVQYGDVEMTQKIQHTYEELLKEFEG